MKRQVKQLVFAKGRTVVTACIVAAGSALLLSGVIRDGPFEMPSWTDAAYAQQGEGRQGQGGNGMQGGKGQGMAPGATGAESRGGRSGVSIEDKVFRGQAGRSVQPLGEDDGEDDSDRPEWAQGNRESNPHAQGGGQPPGAGDKKGDEYGDLYVYLRDPLTGEPVLTIENDVDGDGACDTTDTCYYEAKVCDDAECNTTHYERVYLVWDDGSEKWTAELEEGLVPLEVEFGRASSVRSPAKVTDHALDEAITKISEADDLGLDEAGRIQLIEDGVVVATIDSPLENLALYQALLLKDPQLINVLPDEWTSDDKLLDLAASALAGGADKTGDITVDFVVYQNAIMDVTNNTAIVVPEDDTVSGDQLVSYDYFDYAAVTYDREAYDRDVLYYYTPDGGVTVLQSTVNLADYLDETNPVTVTLSGVELFALEADDSLEIIELMHTQIHDGLLPGDTTP